MTRTEKTTRKRSLRWSRQNAVGRRDGLGAEWDEKIKRLIRGKSREELAEEVLALVRRYPELREEYRERIALSEGDVDRLVAEARRELRDRTSEIGWQNHWQGEGHTPDYSRLKHRLERMVELGHSDAVVALGREFIQRAMAQVEQSHDEGETAMAVAECLPVVFDAVVKSTLSGPEKILFAIDACLNDDYDVIDDSVAVVLDAKWKPADWSAVADELARRLDKMPARRRRFLASQLPAGPAQRLAANRLGERRTRGRIAGDLRIRGAGDRQLRAPGQAPDCRKAIR